jgi:hypothetical protein
MPSSGMLRRVAFVRIDVSEEHPFFEKSHGVTNQKTPFLKDVCLRQTELGLCDELSLDRTATCAFLPSTTDIM